MRRLLGRGTVQEGEGAEGSTAMNAKELSRIALQILTTFEPGSLYIGSVPKNQLSQEIGGAIWLKLQEEREHSTEWEQRNSMIALLVEIKDLLVKIVP